MSGDENNVGQAAAPSLLERIEAAIKKGGAEIEALFHDALTTVESMFETDDGATLNVSVESDPSTSAAAQPASTGDAPKA